MSNVFTNISSLLSKSSTIAKRYLVQHEFTALEKEVTELLISRQLKIMLFGSYNAGKSTLINVLLGGDFAPVKDVPTTFDVDNYDWQGIKLTDTPGINAPIEHEAVTDEQVKRSDLLLFVIREGDQDSKELYKRLFNFIKRGKKVFIVLNHQAANVDDIDKAHQKTFEIIAQYAFEEGVTDDIISNIPVYPINLLTAYKGVIKKSDKLILHSGFNDFNKAFKQWLIQFDNERSYLTAIQNKINEIWLSPIINQINTELGSSKGAGLNSLNEQLSLLKSDKRIILQSASNKLNSEMSLVKTQVLAICKEGGNAEAQLTTVFDSIATKIEAWLTSEIETVSSAILLESNISALNETEPSQESKGGGGSDSLKSIAREKLLDKDVLTEALKVGRSFKIPGLKGRWESTLGKWAGKAAIVLQVGTVIYDGYKASEQQEQLNKRRRQEELRANELVEQICSTVTSDLYLSVEKNIAAFFNSQIKAVTETIQAISSECSEIEKDMQQMVSIKNELTNLYFKS
jgi:ribosome biogenesis GTPase A